MMTNNTCVCGRPFHRHDILNVVVDSLSNGCKKFTSAPTQSEASEPAEGEERVFCGCKPNTVGHEWPCKLTPQPAASQQAPADLVGEALAKLRYAAKYASGPFRTTDEIDFWCGKVLDHADEIEQAFAQHKLQQATSPDAVIDEFVRRVKREMDKFQPDRNHECDDSLEYVAEEMKRK